MKRNMLGQQTKLTDRCFIAKPNVSSYSDIVGDRKTDTLLIFDCWTTKDSIPVLHKGNKTMPRVFRSNVAESTQRKAKGAGPLLQKVNKETLRVTDPLLRK